MNSKLAIEILLFLLGASMLTKANPTISRREAPTADLLKVKYRTVKVDGLDIFYREAGDPEKPTILLLHGFPSTSHMYRELITDLAPKYHLIAPDYPGFGFSSKPAANQFEYSFDHLASIMESFVEVIGLTKFSLYMQDYGGPIGFRIAADNPERISSLIIQNANAYTDGLGVDFKKILELQKMGNRTAVDSILKQIISFDGIREQYVIGTKVMEDIDPDAYITDYDLIKGENTEEIQAALFRDYHNNLLRYEEWHRYFLIQQPPALIVWGKNDPIFIASGAEAYKKDLKKAEIHLLDGGHFALEEYHIEIADYIRLFLSRNGIQ